MEMGVGAHDGGAVRHGLLDRVGVGHVGKDRGFGVLEALEALRKYIVDRLARLDDAGVQNLLFRQRQTNPSKTWNGDVP